jgi:hypothetical protein
MSLYEKAFQAALLNALPLVHDSVTERGQIRIVPREKAVYINKRDVPKKLPRC